MLKNEFNKLKFGNLKDNIELLKHNIDEYTFDIKALYVSTVLYIWGIAFLFRYYNKNVLSYNCFIIGLIFLSLLIIKNIITGFILCSPNFFNHMINDNWSYFKIIKNNNDIDHIETIDSVNTNYNCLFKQTCENNSYENDYHKASSNIINQENLNGYICQKVDDSTYRVLTLENAQALVNYTFNKLKNS